MGSGFSSGGRLMLGVLAMADGDGVGEDCAVKTSAS